MSIEKLSAIIANIIGFKGGIVFNTEKPDGTMRKLTDPAKLHELGWRHKTEVNEGIKQLYNWYIN